MTAPHRAPLVALALALGVCACTSGTKGRQRGPKVGIARVEIAAASRGSVKVTLRYAGELQSDAVDLAARVAGQLTEVNARIGDTVKRGAVLARIDDRTLRRRLRETAAQLRVVRAARQQAAAKSDLARRRLGRTAPLERKKLVSQQEIDDLRTNAAAAEAELNVAAAQISQAEAGLALLRQQLSDARIVAPFDAVIAERRLDAGAYVQVGTAVLRLVHAGALRVILRAPERDLRHIKPGLPLEVTTQATGARRFAGRVERLAGEVSRSDRTIAVEGLLDEPSPLLRPGMFAQVMLLRGEVADATIVPGRAVLSRTDSDGHVRHGVLIADGGRARWRAVTILGREGDRTAVEGKVAPGDPVLVLGHEDLSDGARIKRVTPPGSKTAPPGTNDSAAGSARSGRS